MPNGIVVYGGKELTTFENADIEWSARMLYGEAGGDCDVDREGLAVMWTMINRFAMLYPRFRSFTAMIRGYSQPINPDWMNGGKRDPNPKVKDERELRREAIILMGINKFPEGLLGLVKSLLRPSPSTVVAPPDDMVGLVHFYSPCFYYAKKLKKRQRNLTSQEVGFACRTHFGSSAERLVWKQPNGVNPQGNAFYAVKATSSWKADKVMVISG